MIGCVVLLLGHSGTVQSATFSPDGRRIVTASSDHTARVWDAQTGHEIVCLKAHTDALSSAAFSPDGRRIVTSSGDKTARVWDVSRTEAIVRDRAIVLTAALACGVGWRTESERDDLLMQGAEDDLYAEAVRQLGRIPEDPEITELAAALRAPLHPNCYLSPAQFAEKFGIDWHADRSVVATRQEEVDQRPEQTRKGRAEISGESGPQDLREAASSSSPLPASPPVILEVSTDPYAPVADAERLPLEAGALARILVRDQVGNLAVKYDTAKSKRSARERISLTRGVGSCARPQLLR